MDIKIKGCRHCGGGEEAYCESCYQELIAENARLQNIINKLPLKVKRKFDQKNRILIPVGIMKEVNITENDEVFVYTENGKITIEKIIN